MSLCPCTLKVISVAIQNRLNVVVLMGWGIAKFAVMINTVVVHAYGFPKPQV